MREPDEPEPPAPPEPPASPAKRVADIEHELVNALAAILGFSQVIRGDPSLPDELRRSALLLIEEATRTRRLVRELLDLAGGPAARPSSAAATAAAAGAAAPAANPRLDSERGSDPRAAASGARPRILVLDDQPSIRLYLERALDLLGYEPHMASHGPDAVGLAIDGDHAALLFDHQMAGMSGAQALEAVMAARPDLAARCVLMSADVLDPAIETIAATHAVTLLAKPFDLDTLDSTIRAVMDATAQPRG